VCSWSRPNGWYERYIQRPELVESSNNRPVQPASSASVIQQHLVLVCLPDCRIVSMDRRRLERGAIGVPAMPNGAPKPTAINQDGQPERLLVVVFATERREGRAYP
jgi:hypothetical protein